ncbi:MAG: DUF134 domain-containing protein [Desulfomonile tiedjei]|nr:DUF134 domain-containing protein [Desulfomonile tiedjei]
MARPKFCRRVSQQPAYKVFKPIAVPMSVLPKVVLSMDEFEAIRLADLEGLYHEQAAERMNVSRQTFGRILEAGRHKVAQVLSEGLALLIEGGEVEVSEERQFKCNQCQHAWGVPYGTGRPEECPECKSNSICRSEDQGPRDGNCQRKQCRSRRSGAIRNNCRIS